MSTGVISSMLCTLLKIGCCFVSIETSKVVINWKFVAAVLHTISHIQYRRSSSSCIATFLSIWLSLFAILSINLAMLGRVAGGTSEQSHPGCVKELHIAISIRSKIYLAHAVFVNTPQSCCNPFDIPDYMHGRVARGTSEQSHTAWISTKTVYKSYSSSIQSECLATSTKCDKNGGCLESDAL